MTTRVTRKSAVALASGALLLASSASAFATTSPGLQGYEGQPGNQGGQPHHGNNGTPNGLLGYEGQPGNQGGH